MPRNIPAGTQLDAGTPLLDVWVVKRGTGELTAPDSIEFSVLKDSASVIPWTALNLSTSQVGPGHYAAPWAMPLNQALGAYQIRWRIVVDSGGPAFSFARHFDVVDAALYPLHEPESYATISQIRAEGVTVSDASDARLLDAIYEASRRIDVICGRRFAPYYVERLPCSGDGSRALRFADPVISLRLLELRNEGANPTLFEATSYDVANRHITHPLGGTDDRADPRVTFRSSASAWLGFTSYSFAYGRSPAPVSKFVAHDSAYLATGLFGYTDADGSLVGATPTGIVECCKRIAIASVAPMGGASGSVSGSSGSGVIKSEQTRDQRVDFDTGSSFSTKVGIGGIGELTGNAVTDQMLARYVRPRSSIV